MTAPGIFRFAALVVITGIVFSGSAASAGQWHSNFETAQKEAEKTNKALIVHFYATWCGPCKNMDRTVLHQKEVLAQFGSGVIAVKVDHDQRPDLVRKFGIESLPTDIVVSPQGDVIKRLVGMQSTRSYLSMISQSKEQFPGLTDPEPIVKNIPLESQQEESPSLEDTPGLDGFSPVALARSREWAKGSPEFVAEHQGITYQFCSQEELETFQANPHRYAPRLKGCDPVLLSKEEKAVPGSVKFGAYYEGELYLFSNLDTRTTFKESPYRFVRTRHVLHFDLLHGSTLR